MHKGTILYLMMNHYFYKSRTSILVIISNHVDIRDLINANIILNYKIHNYRAAFMRNMTLFCSREIFFQGNVFKVLFYLYYLLDLYIKK